MAVCSENLSSGCSRQLVVAFKMLVHAIDTTAMLAAGKDAVSRQVSQHRTGRQGR